MIGTKEAARILGLREPVRGPGKAFIWSEDDLRRASWLLRHMDLNDVIAERRAQEDGGSAHA